MKDNRYIVLDKQVSQVKEFLHGINIDIPFFIAGGSIFSILNGKSISNTDIDVYCYDKESVKKIVQYVKDNQQLINRHEIVLTNNAITFINGASDDEMIEAVKPNHDISTVMYSLFDSEDISDMKHTRPIQFIIMSYGQPQEVFDSFDYNCSCISYTSDNKIVAGDNFSNIITYNRELITSDSLMRYVKYTEQKGAEDTDFKTIKKLLEFFSKNLECMFDPKYSQASPISGLTIVNRFLFTKPNYDLAQYIINLISGFSSELKKTYYSTLKESLMHYDFQFPDELNLYIMLDYYREEQYYKNKVDFAAGRYQSFGEIDNILKRSYNNIPEETKRNIILQFAEEFI